jgi:hypothetical protein
VEAPEQGCWGEVVSKKAPVTALQRKKERRKLITLITRDGGPSLLQRVGSTGYYLFGGNFIYSAKSERAAIEQYADTIIRVSDFLRGIRETT